MSNASGRTLRAVSTASAPVFIGKTMSAQPKPRANQFIVDVVFNERATNVPYPKRSVIFLEKGPKREL